MILCGIATLGTVIQCAGNVQKELLPQQQTPTIYKIRRLHAKNNKRAATTAPPAATEAATQNPIESVSPKVKKQRKLTKNAHSLNKNILNKLGFIKVKAPNSHHRKRLAVESRHHASRDDSHMFIIKLPPNLYYYTSPKLSTVSDATNNKKNALIPAQTAQDTNKPLMAAIKSTMSTKPASPTKSIQDKLHVAEALNANGKKVSFPFSSNGRPGRIYHWNLPVLKKALEDRQRFMHVPDTIRQQLLDIKNIPTWSKPWENENDTIEKSINGVVVHKHKNKYSNVNNVHDQHSVVNDGGDYNDNVDNNEGVGDEKERKNGKSNKNNSHKFNYKKSLKSKSPSYYAPINAVNKSSFNKYFAGNGKPKGFYVIKDNQKKPLYYKNIIS